MGAAIRNLHVPLSSEVYAALRQEATRRGLPATQIAREAIERLLEMRRREQIERELAEYIDQAAGTIDDLDPALEKAGIECLLEFERRNRKRRR